MKSDKLNKTSTLAAEVQAGQSDILTLWAAVRNYALKQAHRWHRAFTGRDGIELEDLMQTAFIALLDAMGRWDKDRGPFLPIYEMRLKSAFTRIYGLKTVHDRASPLRDARSLDEPLDDDVTLADAIPDAAATAAFDAIGEQEWLDELRAALEVALLTLMEEQRAAIVANFWHGQRVDPKIRYAALRRLRRASVRDGLKDFI